MDMGPDQIFQVVGMGSGVISGQLIYVVSDYLPGVWGAMTNLEVHIVWGHQKFCGRKNPTARSHIPINFDRSLTVTAHNSPFCK